MDPDTSHTQPAAFSQERDLQTPKYAKQQTNVTAHSFYISLALFAPGVTLSLVLFLWHR